MSINENEKSANLGRCNRRSAWKFLHALGGDEFTFQTFDDDATRKSRSLVRVFHGTIDQHCAALENLNAKGA